MPQIKVCPDCETVRIRLIEVARGRGITHYYEIAPLVSLDMEVPADRDRIAKMLGRISRTESEHGRPMLSALVIRKGTERPGQGFFKLARELRLHDGGDDILFWTKEVRRVHDYWSNQE